MTFTQNVEALVTDSPKCSLCHTDSHICWLILFLRFEQIVKEGYVDDTQFDKTDIHYDP